MQSSAHVALRTARELLRDVTPLKADCGRVCGNACCSPSSLQDGESSGMYLFPEEEHLYGSGDTWARVLPTGWVALGRTVWLLVCDGTCPREKRPLACRLFPLCARSEGESFALRLDPRGWSVCPLMPHGMIALNPAFMKAAQAAFSALWADNDQRAFLLSLEKEIL